MVPLGSRTTSLVAVPHSDSPKRWASTSVDPGVGNATAVSEHQCGGRADRDPPLTTSSSMSTAMGMVSIEGCLIASSISAILMLEMDSTRVPDIFASQRCQAEG